MEEFRLCNSDYRFMMLVWEHAPIGSGELVKLCAEKLGWKKSTTYTEIKRLCEKGVLQNEHAVVTPLVRKCRRRNLMSLWSGLFQDRCPDF